MVNDYIEKLQTNFLKEKVDIEKEINDLELHLKENKELIEKFNENENSNLPSFSPQEQNTGKKKKVRELKEETKSIKEKIRKKKDKNRECLLLIQELNEVNKFLENAMMKQAFVDIVDETHRLTILKTQENERQRISRELHDSTIQNLTSLVYKVELCIKLLEIDPIQCKLELSTMGKMLRDIINDTRQIIYNLHPMSFDDIGLEETIRKALDNLENAEAKKVDFAVLGKPYEINPVIGITILRIVQEACSNAIKHANASFIKVTLQYELNKILLVIEDDGSGFDVEHIDTLSKKDNCGFGLSMMRERIYLLSGTINIESKIGKGTIIYVEVPIVE